MSNKETMLDCPHGLYRIFWESGGTSVAAVGGLYDGTRWLAPTNWTTGPECNNPTTTLEEHIDLIVRMELITT